MTGNVTNTVLSLLDTVSRIRPLMGDAEERLRRTSKLLVGSDSIILTGPESGSRSVTPSERIRVRGPLLKI